VRKILEAFELKGASIKGEGRSFQIVVPRQSESFPPQAVAERLTRAFIIDAYEGKPRRIEFVGPQVGGELAEMGAVALLLTSVAIVLYLWLRFVNWRFGLAAIVANLHDVVIILGFFAFFQWEFSLSVLAGVLAVLGYSVNESVVVFDRVRENFRKMRRATVPEVIDAAITGVISRTIITHLCTQAMATTMFFFGGAALHYFALALTIGICFGIYSSVLVASPLLVWLRVKREWFAPSQKRKSRDEHEGAVV
jgi:preprotein translocase subunit SecF